MWWVYFGGDDTRAEHALAAIDPTRAGAGRDPRLLAGRTCGLLLGIVAVAAGIKKAVGHAVRRTSTWSQALRRSPPACAIYLLSDVGVPAGAAASATAGYRAGAAVRRAGHHPARAWSWASLQLAALIAPARRRCSTLEDRRPRSQLVRAALRP